MRTTPKALQKIQNGSKLLKKFKATSCSCGHAEGSFHNFFEVFWPKVWKIFAHNSKKLWKENEKNCFFRNFYSGHVDIILRTMPNVSAENPKVSKLKENQATKCSSGHVEGSFVKFMNFFGQKSENNLLKNRKKFWKEEQKKLFLPQFLLWALR